MNVKRENLIVRRITIDLTPEEAKAILEDTTFLNHEVEPSSTTKQLISALVEIRDQR